MKRGLRSLMPFLSVAALLFATTPGSSAQLQALLRGVGHSCDAGCGCQRLPRTPGRASTCLHGCTCPTCPGEPHHHHDHDAPEDESGDLASLCPTCPFSPAGTCHGCCPGPPLCCLPDSATA